jgi:hypothetical protein
VSQPLLFADPLAAEFAEFDAANPRVWDLFQVFTRQAIAAGRTRYSSDSILHRIRWHVDIETTGCGGFKINDHSSCFYARKWNEANPGQAIFALRARRSGL